MDTHFPNLASRMPGSPRLPPYLFSSSFPQPTPPPPSLPGNMVCPRARLCLLSLLEASIQALGFKHPNKGYPGGSDGEEYTCGAGDPSDLIPSAYLIPWTEAPGWPQPMRWQRVEILSN